MSIAQHTVGGTVVEPVLDHGAAERARLVNEARAELLKSGGAVTVAMIAEATDRTQDTVRQWVHRYRSVGRLVTVTHGGVALVPTFQLDDGFGLDRDASRIVERLVAHGMSAWAVWDWILAPNTWLDGERPQDVLAAGDVEAVEAAVAGLFQE